MASAGRVRDGGKNKQELGVPLTVHSFFNIDQSPSLNLVFTHPQPSDTPGHMSPPFFLLSMANLHPSPHLAPHCHKLRSNSLPSLKPTPPSSISFSPLLHLEATHSMMERQMTRYPM